jgi:hypothetical protein
MSKTLFCLSMIFATNAFAVGSLDISGTLGPGVKIVSVDAVYATLDPSENCAIPFAQDAGIITNGVTFRARLATRLTFRDVKLCQRRLQSIDISYMVVRDYGGIKSVDSCNNFNFEKSSSDYGVMTTSFKVDETLPAQDIDGVSTECALGETDVVDTDVSSSPKSTVILGKCKSSQAIGLNPETRNIIRNFDITRDLPKLPNTGVVQTFTFEDAGFLIDVHPNEGGDIAGLSFVTLARTYIKPYLLKTEPGEYLLKSFTTDNGTITSLSLMGYNPTTGKSHALEFSPQSGEYVESVRISREPSSKKSKYRPYLNASGSCQN